MDGLSSTAFFAGIVLRLGLVVAVGPQNLHLLHAGLARTSVGIAVAFGVGTDLLLVALALAGLGAGLDRAPLRAAALVPFANPAVYCETLLLVGGASATLRGADRASSGAGAVVASLLWFGSLGHGARLAARWLRDGEQARLGWWTLNVASAALMVLAAANLAWVDLAPLAQCSSYRRMRVFGQSPSICSSTAHSASCIFVSSSATSCWHSASRPMLLNSS